MQEQVMTSAAVKREKRNAAIKERYNELMAAGSKASAVHRLLSDEFEVTLPTIIRAIKGAPVPRKKHRKRA